MFVKPHLSPLNPPLCPVFYAISNQRTITENNSHLQYNLVSYAYKCKYLSVKVEMYQVISIAAVVSYFVPLFIVLIKKAWRDPFFRLFAIYWSIGGLVNIFDVLPGISKDTIRTIGILYNMLDIPFILGILYYTTSYTFIRKTATVALVLFITTQLIGVFKSGLDYDAIKYPLGIGVGSVLVIVTMEIIRYMQKIEHSTRQNAKMFVYAAVLFEYATFIVIYIFDYILNTENRQDSFIIYYLSSVVAILIASCGFLMYKKYGTSLSK